MGKQGEATLTHAITGPTHRVKGADHTLLVSNGVTALWSAIPPLAGIADTGDTTRIAIGTSSPNVKVTGNTQLGATSTTSDVVGLGSIPTATRMLQIAPTPSTRVSSFRALSITPTWISAGDGSFHRGIFGSVEHKGDDGTDSGHTGLQSAALEFTILDWTQSGDTDVFSNTHGIKVTLQYLNFGTLLTATNSYGIEVVHTLAFGSAVFNHIYGIKLNDPNMAGAVNYTGLQIDDESTASGNIYLMQIGPPSTPALRVVGDQATTKGANLTSVWISEGSTPTLRQLKTKAGDTLGSGDLVCVLV